MLVMKVRLVSCRCSELSPGCGKKRSNIPLNDTWCRWWGEGVDISQHYVGLTTRYSRLNSCRLLLNEEGLAAGTPLILLLTSPAASASAINPFRNCSKLFDTPDTYLEKTIQEMEICHHHHHHHHRKRGKGNPPDYRPRALESDNRMREY